MQSMVTAHSVQDLTHTDIYWTSHPTHTKIICKYYQYLLFYMNFVLKLHSGLLLWIYLCCLVQRLSCQVGLSRDLPGLFFLSCRTMWCGLYRCCLCLTPPLWLPRSHTLLTCHPTHLHTRKHVNLDLTLFIWQNKHVLYEFIVQVC